MQEHSLAPVSVHSFSDCFVSFISICLSYSSDFCNQYNGLLSMSIIDKQHIYLYLIQPVFFPRIITGLICLFLMNEDVMIACIFFFTEKCYWFCL